MKSYSILFLFYFKCIQNSYFLPLYIFRTPLKMKMKCTSLIGKPTLKMTPWIGKPILKMTPWIGKPTLKMTPWIGKPTLKMTPWLIYRYEKLFDIVFILF